MKRFIFIAAVVLCASVLSAGTLDKVVIQLNNAPTNSTTKESTGSRITGYIERIDTFKATTNTINISVSFSNVLTGNITTVLEPGAVGSSTIYYPRYNAQNTEAASTFTNDAQRFMVLDEVPYLSAISAKGTNQNVRAVIFYERP